MSLNKLSNQYADAVFALYNRTPKAVFAAMAVSALTCGGDWIDDGRLALATALEKAEFFKGAQNG